jgi:amino acid transporter
MEVIASSARFQPYYCRTVDMSLFVHDSGGVMATEVTKPGAPGGAESVSLEVFSRKTSGIVREFSATDTMWYGVLAAAALFALLWIYPGPQSYLPGLSVPINAVIALVVGFAVFALYAGLGSAMPRMGGDYLFQSRSIHPVVGFSMAFAWEVFIWVTFTTTGGLVVTTLGLQPLLYNLGLVWNSQGLLDAAGWVSGSNGILVITLILILLAFWTTVAGLRTYRRIQRWVIVPTVVLSNVILIILLAVNSHQSYLDKMNAWYAKATGDADFTGTLAKAVGDGFHAPAFSWKYTILFLSISGMIWYAVFSAQGLLGEIKNANSFHKLFRTFMVAGVFVSIATWILPIWLFQNAVGKDFLYSYATAYADGSVEAPAGAYLSSIAMMLTSNPLVLILLSLGFITVGYYFAVCVFLNMTRVMGAMGMDRTLPEWFAKVNQKYHAPVNAAIFYLILALALNVLYRFNADVSTTMILGGAFTSTGVIAISGLAGMLFPYTAKAIHDVSPIGRYKVAGIPLISIVGTITFIVAGTVTVLNLIYPELGFTTGAARAFLVVTPILAAVWFFGYRAYLKSRGINIDLAFKQVPPE